MALETRDELPEHTSGRFTFGGGFMAEPATKPEESLPNRYEIRDRDDGRVLLCGEAPGVAVSIERTYQYTEADARRMGRTGRVPRRRGSVRSRGRQYPLVL